MDLSGLKKPALGKDQKIDIGDRNKGFLDSLPCLLHVQGRNTL